MSSKVLFLTLRVFSATGGIEKVCKVLGKALQEINEDFPGNVSVYSMYDSSSEVDNRYLPAESFRGFNNVKSLFMWAAFFAGIRKEYVIISHINLLIPAFLIKLCSPKTKVIVLAHGIEVWKTMPGWKQRILKKCDRILPVSYFTKEKMKVCQQLPENKFSVLNNCLDPYLKRPLRQGKDATLLKRYGFTAESKILMTLTRLSSKEKYKGYDIVLHALPFLKQQCPEIKYLIVGKYDEAEKERLAVIIRKLNLQDDVVVTGFVPDEEIAAHFETADIYIMPSKKEGFGLVFIEAMYYGKPVIAGNKDGSSDALCNGEFGILVDPDNMVEIQMAVTRILENTEGFIPNPNAVLEKFNFEGYKQRLKHILSQL